MIVGWEEDEEMDGLRWILVGITQERESCDSIMSRGILNHGIPA